MHALARATIVGERRTSSYWAHSETNDKPDVMTIPCAVIWPRDDAGDDIVHWGFVAGRLGATPELPRPFLIGIRGAAPFDRETHQAVSRPKYDDTFVLLTSDAPPVVFAAATHAYQVDSREAPDVDHDGRPDVGAIRCGRYLLRDMRTGGYPIFELTLPDGTKQIPAYRDTDHDGVISDAEVKQAEQARPNPARPGDEVGSDGYYAVSVLLHTGFDAPPDSQHRSSIACQTCSLKWLTLLSAAAKPSSGLIDYVLVNAADLVPIAEDRLRVSPAAPERGPNIA
jgi:hypothetical protein